MIKQIPRNNLIFFGGALLLFLVIQILISLELLNPFWSTIILQGGVIAIVAIGLNLIYGFNGQFSLGQWGFYGMGAYCSADITYRWVNDKSAAGLIVMLLAVVVSGIAILFLQRALSRVRGLDALSAFTLYLATVAIVAYLSVVVGGWISPAISLILGSLPDAVSTQIVYVLSIIIAGCFAAEVSFLFGLPVLTLGSDYFGIATLGLTIIVKVLLDNSDSMLGFVEMKGARGMVGIPKLTNWFWVFIFLFVVVWIVRNLLHSSYGRAVISVREDEIAAKAMGIDIAEFKIITFVMGSFLAGMAGGLYAHINGFLHPNTFNFIQSFNPMIIVVMGGLGSITGTLAASFAWALILEGVLRLILPQGFETWRFVVYPILLLLIMLLRPKGMFGDYEMPFLRQIIPALKKNLIKSNSSPNPIAYPGGSGEAPKPQEASK